jgi:uncharacterized Zn-finger protein
LIKYRPLKDTIAISQQQLDIKDSLTEVKTSFSLKDVALSVEPSPVAEMPHQESSLEIKKNDQNRSNSSLISTKKYICLTCDKPFAQKCHLVAHERIHSQKKPYKCNSCDKAFAQKTNLVVHMRVHSQEKPYKCNSCDMAFAKKTDLVRHTRIHSQEKPYKCNLCDKAFSLKQHLLRHTRLSHPNTT